MEENISTGKGHLDPLYIHNARVGADGNVAPRGGDVGRRLRVHRVAGRVALRASYYQLREGLLVILPVSFLTI